ATANGVSMVLDAEGVRATYQGLEVFMPWRTVDSVFHFEKSLAIGASGTFLIVPVEALPDGLSLEEMSAKVATWRSAA
ncbi:MAG: hypothetical protein AAF968_26520, partial [Pseudomonadota bacterium]